MGYATSAWTGFGGALAAVAGALTGLLFVAVSIRSDLLARSRSLASRAAQALVLFMIAVLAGLITAAPQPRLATGLELIALAATATAILRVLDRRAGPSADSAGRAERYVERFSPNLITAILVALAGLTLAIGAGGGLFWLIPAAAASLVGGVTSAWLFLVRGRFRSADRRAWPAGRRARAAGCGGAVAGPSRTQDGVAGHRPVRREAEAPGRRCRLSRRPGIPR